MNGSVALAYARKRVGVSDRGALEAKLPYHADRWNTCVLKAIVRLSSGANWQNSANPSLLLRKKWRSNRLLPVVVR
jgi:hypothetical protein